MIMMGQDFENPWGLTTPKGELRMMSHVLDMAVFPGIQGGPLEHVIAGKAVAYGEALSDEYFNYIVQVRKNAQAMAKALVDRGYDIVSGGTDNHLMLVDLRPKKLTGKVAEVALVKAGITAPILVLSQPRSDDFDAAVRAMDAREVNARWQAGMARFAKSAIC